MLKNNKHNVLFVTLDSCRYDTAVNSYLPFLNSLSKMKKGEAPGSYTLPSHISYFSGILPNLIDGDQYLDSIDQIWRSVNAKVRNKKVAITFEGSNIIDYYQQQNYSVVGVGGVSFFKKNKNNILPSLFNNFIHFSKTSKENSLIRSDEESPLLNQHIEIILQNLDKNKPFFLFINCPETHIPYNCPVSQNIDENYIKLISKIYSLDFIKSIDKQHPVVLSPEERNIILNQQQKSLEWIDQQLSILVNKLPQNGLETLVIVLSDHGEELGEGGRIGHAHVHQTVMEVPIWCSILRRHK